MLEKILRRFVNEDTKIILAAVEKWSEHDDVYNNAKLTSMMLNYTKVCPVMDKAVIYKTKQRCDMVRIEAHMREESLDTAAKVLMGEKFEPKMGQANPTVGNAQAQASNAAQQAQYNQLSNMANTMAMAGPAYQNAMQLGLVDPRAQYRQGPHTSITTTGMQP